MKLSQLIAEIGDLMLGIRIRGPGWEPALDVLRKELCCILGVGNLVQRFAILPSPGL